MKVGSIVAPREGCSWGGHHHGIVLALWQRPGTAEMAEVRWQDGKVGSWPVYTLAVKAEVVGEGRP